MSGQHRAGVSGARFYRVCRHVLCPEACPRCRDWLPWLHVDSSHPEKRHGPLLCQAVLAHAGLTDRLTTRKPPGRPGGFFVALVPDQTMSSPLMLYDNYTRTLRAFEPLKAGEVGLYTCGPTVYSRAPHAYGTSA